MTSAIPSTQSIISSLGSFQDCYLPIVAMFRGWLSVVIGPLRCRIFRIATMIIRGRPRPLFRLFVASARFWGIVIARVKTVDGMIRVLRSSIIIIVKMVVDSSFRIAIVYCNDRGPSFEEVPAEPEVVAIVAEDLLPEFRLLPWVDLLPEEGLISATSLVATVGRLTTKRVSAATSGRLTTGRRDATVGRLISTTSLVATVGRLTTKVGREDDAPPVPSAA